MAYTSSGTQLAARSPVRDRGRALRRVTGPIGLALPLILACGAERPPAVVAVASGGPFLSGARLALEGVGAGALEGVDSVILEEGTNLSMPAVENAGRLVTVPGLAAIVGHANSVASLAAAPIYHAHEVVQIAPTTTAPTYSEAGPYSFRMVPSDDRQGPFLVRAIVEAYPQGARLALVYVNDDYGRGLREAFLSALPSDGFPVAIELPYAAGDPAPDETAAEGAAALVAARPEVVVWLARQGLLGRFLPTLRSGLPGVAIYGGDAISQHPTDLPPDSPWHGVRYADFFDPTATAALRSFAERHRARFGSAPNTAGILTYEAVRLVLAGIVEGARTGPDLRDWLDSLGRERPAWRGLTGPISFDRNGDLQRDYVLLTVGEGDNS